MTNKAEAIYLDDMGNVVPREQARRIRITLVDPKGNPVREIWGTVTRPGDLSRWPNWESDYDLMG
jgi:hypothetical protein